MNINKEDLHEIVSECKRRIQKKAFMCDHDNDNRTSSVIKKCDVLEAVDSMESVMLDYREDKREFIPPFTINEIDCGIGSSNYLILDSNDKLFCKSNYLSAIELMFKGLDEEYKAPKNIAKKLFPNGIKYSTANRNLYYIDSKDRVIVVATIDRTNISLKLGSLMAELINKEINK